MLITGGSKRDYYDGVVGTVGIDKTIVYNREVIEFSGNEIPKSFKDNSYYTLGGRKDVNPLLLMNNFDINHKLKMQWKDSSYFVVGFCGKLYVGWKLYSENKVGINCNINTTIRYDFEFIKTIFNLKSFGRTNMIDAYNNFNNYDAIELFREFKTPIFIYDSLDNVTSISKHYGTRSNPKLIINGNLNDYKFYRIFDSFQAFQEIQMFMGSLGSNENKLPIMDDKHKIAQHGFDKFSFRKEKEVK